MTIHEMFRLFSQQEVRRVAGDVICVPFVFCHIRRMYLRFRGFEIGLIQTDREPPGIVDVDP